MANVAFYANKWVLIDKCLIFMYVWKIQIIHFHCNELVISNNNFQQMCSKYL